ncbi:chitobiase/beta-hexosaminidase C-terminal domain-containing protein [Halobacillus yeomjeoni]|uniref:Chitobiase/beta-hexosaminidase C-terminal domain-containing protein n=1 Tax=Halobacillus yeomjeoni TaxID=311194 RepID=A0A931MVY6_9BACI|nr:chitobiase/beta-hexosaminidase C-terminal domain-containing protein [Halobacillus yeomjeoni]MBH0230866.1 chitobiase/beta-hexosaminidase C-terminal domain-containing protein [Halobacillus yeomjeoni]
MFRKSFFYSLFILFLVCTFINPVSKMSAAEEVQSIADVRKSEGGAQVAAKGVATASFDVGGETNLYIQDDTAGIVVRAEGLNIDVGERVQASGEFYVHYGLEQIKSESTQVKILEKAEEPEVKKITSSDFGEEVEAELVQVGPVEITQVDQYGNYTAEDKEGTFIIQPQVEKSLEVGKTYEQIQGVVSYSYGDYKLLPRSSSDIVEKIFSVTATPDSGGVVTGEEVVLNTAEPGASIHYTVDGSTPNADSQKYTGPIEIQEDVKIKAVAVRENGELSEVSTFAFTALEPLDELEIHDIQGAGHISPYAGSVVEGVEGVVTNVDGKNTFYMQSLNPDDDIATSEGILVYNKSHSLKVGNHVEIRGKVKEWREDGFNDADDLLTTEISAYDVNVLSSSHDLPAPVVIGEDREQPTEVIENDGMDSFDPQKDGLDFYESLEGMLVELPEPKVSGPVKYDELPVFVEASEDQLFTRAEGLLISEEDLNPERMLVDVEGLEIQAKTGDYFEESITGIVSYDYSNFKIRPTGDFPSIKDGGTERQEAKLKNNKIKLTVASYNVENFSAETKPEKVNKIASSIVDRLNTPDIIGLIEMQDNNGPEDDGTVDASESYQKLIDAIKEAGGPSYEFTDIAPEDKKDGGQPGGNIRVGFLYNPDRVSMPEKPDGDATTAVDVNEDGLTLNPGRIDPTNGAFYDSRKPLAAEFVFNGEKIIVVANHFNSKGGDDALFGSSHPVELNSEKQRLQQAIVVNKFVNKVDEKMKDAKVVVLGDLNDFEFSSPIDTLEGNVLKNMMEEVPHEERYTYIYQGNSQVLDHILVSHNLKKDTKIETVNINSDFSKEAGRASDHDPVLAQIKIKKNKAKDDEKWFSWFDDFWNQYFGEVEFE